MNVKRIKRKCGVRGCKNIVSFALSKTREFGNSVIMCRECMQEALKATESYTEPEKVKKEVKPLFPHPEKEVTLSSVAENKPEPVEVIEPTEESNTSVTENLPQYASLLC